MDEELTKYRQELIDTQRKLNDSYDKLLVTLSGGALALSITFLKDIVGSNDIIFPQLLLSSWGLFVLSLTSILGEILFGIKAHKKAICQIDDGSIYENKAGGLSSYLSTLLHWVAALSLIVGLLFISSFVFYNVGENNAQKATTTTATAHNSQTNTNPRTQTVN